MDRVSVTSSNVASVGYDEENKMMEVEFNSGSVYWYYDVPRETYEGMLSAGSVGGYFNEYVKGVFAYS